VSTVTFAGGDYPIAGWSGQIVTRRPVKQAIGTDDAVGALSWVQPVGGWPASQISVSARMINGPKSNRPLCPWLALI
jgi:hypothetical protein